MQQIVKVTRLLEPGYAEVFLTRQSACSGDCGSCGGCGAAKETLLVRAKNDAGARPGDRVVVETETGSVLLSAALVYLVPLLLFFLGWFGFASLSWAQGLGGGIGFLLGIVPVLLRNRSLRRRTQFRIVRCVEDG